MILVTGVNGFIGKHLLTSLIEQKGRSQVLAFTSKPVDECAYLLHHHYEFAPDFLQVNGYTDIRTVIHLGGFIPKNSNEVNDVKKCTSNIDATKKLLNALPPSVERFLFISTVDVYSPGADEVITEQTLVNPASLYGHSKYYCEKMIEAWGNANNAKIQVLRLGHVYGPGENEYKKIIPVTIAKLKEGEQPQIWGNGSEKRSFIYVDDVIRVIIKAIDSVEITTPVNVVGGNSISVSDLTKLLIKISGLNIEPEFIRVDKNQRSLMFDNRKMKEVYCDEIFTMEKGLQLEWEYATV